MTVRIRYEARMRQRSRGFPILPEIGILIFLPLQFFSSVAFCKSYDAHLVNASVFITLEFRCRCLTRLV